LICRTRTFVFFAPTIEEKNEWVKDLRASVTGVKHSCHY
jgi:hypothetical protein